MIGAGCEPPVWWPALAKDSRGLMARANAVVVGDANAVPSSDITRELRCPVGCPTEAQPFGL